MFLQKLKGKIASFPYYKKMLFIGIGVAILFLMIISLIKFGHILAFILVYNWLANTISGAIGINIWLVRAVALSLAILVVYALGLCLSRREQKRRVGIVMLASLASISFLTMFFITKDQFFSRTTGQSTKYYVMTLDGPVISDSPGYDPKYGEKLSVLSAEKTKEILATRGEIEVAKNREIFFSPHTGEPVKWYCRNDDKLEIFSQPGFHPKTSQALKPVTPEVMMEYLKGEMEIKATAAAKVAKEMKIKADAAADAAGLFWLIIIFGGIPLLIFIINHYGEKANWW